MKYRLIILFLSLFILSPAANVHASEGDLTDVLSEGNLEVGLDEDTDISSEDDGSIEEFSDEEVQNIKIKYDAQIKRIVSESNAEELQLKIAEFVLAKLLTQPKYKGRFYKIEIKDIYPDGSSNYRTESIKEIKGKVEIPLLTGYVLKESSGEFNNLEIVYDDMPTRKGITEVVESDHEDSISSQNDYEEGDYEEDSDSSTSRISQKRRQLRQMALEQEEKARVEEKREEEKKEEAKPKLKEVVGEKAEVPTYDLSKLINKNKAKSVNSSTGSSITIKDKDSLKEKSDKDIKEQGAASPINPGESNGKDAHIKLDAVHEVAEDSNFELVEEDPKSRLLMVLIFAFISVTCLIGIILLVRYVKNK